MDSLQDHTINTAINYNNVANAVETSGQSSGIVPGAEPFTFELEDVIENTNYIGGGKGSTMFSGVELVPYVENGSDVKNEYSYRYVGHGIKSHLESIEHNTNNIICNIPLVYIVERLTRPSILSLAKQHGIVINTKSSKSDIISAFFNAHTYTCNGCISAFHQVDTQRIYNHSYSEDHKIQDRFLPLPSTMQSSERIIKDFISATSPGEFEEGGCAVCGSLSLKSSLTELSEADVDLSLLVAGASGFTRKEQHSSSDPIIEFHGPILERQCKHICKPCMAAVKWNQKPKFALSRGLWIGAVPHQ